MSLIDKLSTKLYRTFSKPEYFFKPSQIVRRLAFKKHQNQRLNIFDHQNKSPFYVSSQDVIGQSLLTFGVYDLVVAEALLRILKPRDLFFDVGANIGYFSRLGLTQGAKVSAFEPHPKIFSTLQQNTNINFNQQTNKPTNPNNDIGSIVLHNTALSDQTGQLDLYIPPDFDNNHGVASLESKEGCERFQVQTQKLDHFKADQIKLLKIDVEGHELSVLKGAFQKLTQKEIEYIIFEDFNGPQSAVIQLLLQFGFHIYLLKKTFWGPELVALAQIKDISPYEPPNYIAALNDDSLHLLFKKRSWQFYSKKNPLN